MTPTRCLVTKNSASLLPLKRKKKMLTMTKTRMKKTKMTREQMRVLLEKLLERLKIKGQLRKTSETLLRHQETREAKLPIRDAALPRRTKRTPLNSSNCNKLQATSAVPRALSKSNKPLPVAKKAPTLRRRNADKKLRKPPRRRVKSLISKLKMKSSAFAKSKRQESRRRKSASVRTLCS